MPDDVSRQRIPPNDMKAEQAVLGGVMLDNRSIHEVMEILGKSDYFYFDSHKAVYEGILKLADQAEPIDMLTVKDALEKIGKLDMAGGFEYLTELASMVPTAAHAARYARIVREKALLRSALSVGFDILAEAYDEPENVENFLDGIEKRFSEVQQERLGQSFDKVGSVVNEAIKRIEELDASTGSIIGVPTGFYDIDKKTTGLLPGSLVILAARPSMGKTSLALNIAMNAAIDHGKRVGFFSLEMTAVELVIRMLCSLARVDSQKFKTGRLNDQEWINLTEAADRLREAPIYIDDDSFLSITEFKGKARRMAQNYGVDIVILDYLQLMNMSTGVIRRDAGRQEEISYISRSLKGLAKELQIPVLTLSQLNRELEKRQDKHPQMSDLRESGALEQDADVIMFIYRDVVHNPDNTEKENVAEVNIAKQRSGPTGPVDLRYFKKYTLFENFRSDDDVEGYEPL